MSHRRILRAAGLAGVMLFAWPLCAAVYAQATGGGGGTDFIGDLWSKVQQAGPFVGLFGIWQMLRAEGRAEKLQSERGGLLERVITALNTATLMVDRQSVIIDQLLRRAGAIGSGPGDSSA